jgi:hypothetical protein
MAVEAPKKEEKPKAVARKPGPKEVVTAIQPVKIADEPAKGEAPAPVAVPVAVQEMPKPVLVRAAPMASSSPRFNDLVTAVIYGDAFAVQQLLGYGKWPDKPDSRGVTPLMLAAQFGDATLAEVLLKAGANPNHPGPGGETATTIARERSDAAMLGLLKRYGGK